MLSHINIILATANKEFAQRFTEEFSGRWNAIVHVAEDRFDAVGLYWNLYNNEIIPNVFVSDFWLGEPQSELYDEMDEILEGCTCMPVIRTIKKLDDSTACFIYSELPELGKDILTSYGFDYDDIRVLNSDKVSLEELANIMVTDFRLNEQVERKKSKTSYRRIRSNH